MKAWASACNTYIYQTMCPQGELFNYIDFLPGCVPCISHFGTVRDENTTDFDTSGVGGGL